MKKYLILLFICCLVSLVTMAQTTGENNRDNTPHNGQDPCAGHKLKPTLLLHKIRNGIANATFLIGWIM